MSSSSRSDFSTPRYEIPTGNCIAQYSAKSERLKRAKVMRQLRRLDFQEVGLHVLDDAVADRRRQQLRNGGVNRGRRGKRPAGGGLAFHDLGDMFGELFT